MKSPLNHLIVESCVLFLLLLSLPSLGSTEGFCIRNNDGKLSTKATTEDSCPKKQAFIPKVAGPQGETGPQGATGLQGATGATGPAGEDGSARGYGFVSSAGNINTSLSSSNVSARKVSTGVYCISAGGISPTSVMPVVSADQDDGNGSFHIAQIKSSLGGAFGCTSSEWSVHTSNFSSGSFAASNCAFSFIIP